MKLHFAECAGSPHILIPERVLFVKRVLGGVFASLRGGWAGGDAIQPAGGSNAPMVLGQVVRAVVVE